MLSVIAITGIGLLFSSPYGSYGILILGSVITLVLLVKLVSGAKNLLCTIERYYYSQSLAIMALMLAGAIVTMFSGISLIIASFQSRIYVSAILYVIYASTGVIIIGIIAFVINVTKHRRMTKFKDQFTLVGSDIEEFKKSPISFALFETYWALCSSREKFHLWLWELPPEYCTPPPLYDHIFPDEFPPAYDEHERCAIISHAQ